jgi:hypothetical protein
MADIATLFTRDPLSMSNEDFEQIVSKFRENRHAFVAGPASKPAAKPKAAVKKLDLDLEIDI